MLDQLARILKPGAELRFASDDAGYLAYALERLMAHPAFAWTATGPSDWKTRPADWPATRYEAKELHGSPAFLRFVRTDKLAPCWTRFARYAISAAITRSRHGRPRRSKCRGDMACGERHLTCIAAGSYLRDKAYPLAQPSRKAMNAGSSAHRS